MKKTIVSFLSIIIIAVFVLFVPGYAELYDEYGGLILPSYEETGENEIDQNAGDSFYDGVILPQEGIIVPASGGETSSLPGFSEEEHDDKEIPQEEKIPSDYFVTFGGRFFVDSDWDHTPDENDPKLKDVTVRIYNANTFVPDDMRTDIREDLLCCAPVFPVEQTGDDGIFYVDGGIKTGTYTVVISGIPYYLLNNGYAINFPFNDADYNLRSSKKEIYINAYQNEAEIVIPSMTITEDVYFVFGTAQIPLQIIMQEDVEKNTEPERKNISVRIEWDDDYSLDRPYSVTVALTGTVKDNEGTDIIVFGPVEKTVSEDTDGVWNCEYEELPVMYGGDRIQYSVTEYYQEGYEIEYNGFVIRNTK